MPKMKLSKMVCEEWGGELSLAEGSDSEILSEFPCVTDSARN